jgi:hypothetical protein
MLEELFAMKINDNKVQLMLLLHHHTRPNHKDQPVKVVYCISEHNNKKKESRSRKKEQVLRLSRDAVN